MTLRLYELVGANDIRFSPYCWRVRMALAHKGLAAEIVPCKFTDKALIAFSGQTRVPVLVDGERVIADSWNIACYLEDAYPDRPSLFGPGLGRRLTRFFNLWVDGEINPTLLRMIVRDILDIVHPDDREYFRSSREARFGQPLETVQSERHLHMERLAQFLIPVRTMLADSSYLCGDSPGYADYILFGTFQWVRCSSELEVLDSSDPIFEWRERMLDLYGGVARRYGRAMAIRDRST